ncbi:MAG: hypothetical protein LBM09_02940 [Candidatus Nomurabacteria bacterium]|jgi:hypothetical protein|nr:hypothetical protein [Candidatus Nomurabacteria bacterium]
MSERGGSVQGGRKFRGQYTSARIDRLSSEKVAANDDSSSENINELDAVFVANNGEVKQPQLDAEPIVEEVNDSEAEKIEVEITHKPKPVAPKIVDIMPAGQATVDHLPRANADGKPNADQQANMNEAIDKSTYKPRREEDLSDTNVESVKYGKPKHFPIIGWIFAILLLFMVGVAVAAWVYLNHPEWLNL